MYTLSWSQEALDVDMVNFKQDNENDPNIYNFKQIMNDHSCNAPIVYLNATCCTSIDIDKFTP